MYWLIVGSTPCLRSLQQYSRRRLPRVWDLLPCARHQRECNWVVGVQACSPVEGVSSANPDELERFWCLVVHDNLKWPLRSDVLQIRTAAYHLMRTGKAMRADSVHTVAIHTTSCMFVMLPFTQASSLTRPHCPPHTSSTGHPGFRIDNYYKGPRDVRHDTKPVYFICVTCTSSV